MQNKVRQITDSIHGTIQVSTLEYHLMSTPFFNRLNDVYQNSTVYMTFPSNRTKRFEHSLGTMHLAGQMFYSGVTNADTKDKMNFLLQMKDQFEAILAALNNRNEVGQIHFYQRQANNLGELMPKGKQDTAHVIKLIKDTWIKAPIKDRALEQQDINFFNLLNQSETADSELDQIYLYAFLYQCTLEALRVAAMFHDIGHPPFSHIIESTLEKIYRNGIGNNDCDDAGRKYISEKWEEFKRIIGGFLSKNKVQNLLLKSNACCNESHQALHESIGTEILMLTYRSVLDDLIPQYTKNKNCENRLKALYLLTVIEFTFGILLEKSPILSSLHRIIDGPVDVDRLDYVYRDSKNSGVSWGRISYNRIINGVKFVYRDDVLKIAFPEKVCEDIDDLFISRYKIFQQINYHHKSVKTGELLQRSVEMLAKDFLLSEAEKEISPEIGNLWKFLDATLSNSEAENQIIQWTDSWLVSVLGATFNKLSDKFERNNFVDEKIGRTAQNLDVLFKMIEEVQLSKKRYYPLLKRQRDALILKDIVMNTSVVSNENLDKISTHEYEKLNDEDIEEKESAREALYRIELLKNEVLNVANFGLLDVILPSERTCQQIIEDVLNKKKSENIIQDYFLSSNLALYKLGAKDTTEIILYRHDNQTYTYDTSTCLMKKLNAYRAGCLWLFVYISFSQDSTEENVDLYIDNISKEIAQNIAEEMHSQMNYLFGLDKLLQS